MTTSLGHPEALGFGHLFDRIADAVIVYSGTSGRIVLWNEAATRIFGYTVAEVETLNVAALLRPDDLPLLREAQAYAQSTGRSRAAEAAVPVEARLVRKDGGTVDVEVTISPIPPPLTGGTPGDGPLLLAIARDITERTRALAAKAALAAVVESSGDAIITKTLDGTITSWNPAAEQLYGYRADEVIGQSLSVIVPPERQDELRNILAQVGRGERVVHHETERLRKDGTHVPVSVTVSPVRDGSGAVVGASAIARDVSERRRADAARQEAARLAGALLAARTAAHLVNNQLTSAVGYCELLAMNPTLPEALRPMARAALEGAMRAAETIQQLGRIVRLEQIVHADGQATIDLPRSEDFPLEGSEGPPPGTESPAAVRPWSSRGRGRRGR